MDRGLMNQNHRPTRLIRRVRCVPDARTDAAPAVKGHRRFDLYGCRLGSLDEVHLLVESGLGRRMSEHDSSYVGGTYLRAASPPEEIEVISHDPDDEGYYQEDAFKEWPFMIYVSASTRWPELGGDARRDATSRAPQNRIDCATARDYS